MKKNLYAVIACMLLGTSIVGADTINIVGTYTISTDTLKRVESYMTKKMNRVLPKPQEGKQFGKYSREKGVGSRVDSRIDEIYKENIESARKEIKKIVSSFKKCRMIFQKNNRAILKAIDVTTGAEYTEQGTYLVAKDVLVIEWKRSREKFRIQHWGRQIVKITRWSYPFPLVFVKQSK